MAMLKDDNSESRKWERSRIIRPIRLQVAPITMVDQLIWHPATLIDYSDFGLGIQLSMPAMVGHVFLVRGLVPEPNSGDTFVITAEVRWCRAICAGMYRLGLQLDSDYHSALVRRFEASYGREDSALVRLGQALRECSAAKTTENMGDGNCEHFAAKRKVNIPR